MWINNTYSLKKKREKLVPFFTNFTNFFSKKKFVLTISNNSTHIKRKFLSLERGNFYVIYRHQQIGIFSAWIINISIDRFYLPETVVETWTPIAPGTRAGCRISFCSIKDHLRTYIRSIKQIKFSFFFFLMKVSIRKLGLRDQL